MSIEFITTPFLGTHGKQPKGTGCWAFSEERNPGIEDLFFTGCMTYGEANKQAKKHFAGKTDRLFVQG
ncbi:MAG: hypothetical protein H0X02_12350 [Nitrosomonas sp.]|nr:hypothetical protein [Nitrosomonas sp.]